MHLIDLVLQPLPPVSRAEPLTLIFGGHVAGADGRVSQADIVISAGMIAEIGSLVCLPADAELIDAAGSLVRPRAAGILAPGQAADVELVPLDGGAGRS